MLNNYTSDYICPHGNKTFHLFTLLHMFSDSGGVLKRFRRRQRFSSLLSPTPQTVSSYTVPSQRRTLENSCSNEETEHAYMMAEGALEPTF